MACGARSVWMICRLMSRSCAWSLAALFGVGVAVRLGIAVGVLVGIGAVRFVARVGGDGARQARDVRHAADDAHQARQVAPVAYAQLERQYRGVGVLLVDRHVVDVG